MHQLRNLTLILSETGIDYMSDDFLHSIKGKNIKIIACSNRFYIDEICKMLRYNGVDIKLFDDQPDLPHHKEFFVEFMEFLRDNEHYCDANRSQYQDLRYSLNKAYQENLNSLDLSYSDIVLPTHLLAKLNFVENLSLAGNYIEEYQGDVLEGVAILPNLKFLDLRDNGLTTLPSVFFTVRRSSPLTIDLRDNLFSLDEENKLNRLARNNNITLLFAERNRVVTKPDLVPDIGPDGTFVFGSNLGENEEIEFSKSDDAMEDAVFVEDWVRRVAKDLSEMTIGKG